MKDTTRSSPRTKHDQLVEKLTARAAALPIGASLPPERDLAVEFGVARMTIRQALDVLERRGTVERRRGAGTFSSSPKFDHALKLTSFTDDMKRLGMYASTVSLGGGKRLAGEFAPKLGLATSDEIWRVGRLRLADDEPMAIEWVSIPAKAIPGAVLDDLLKDSLYRLFRDEFSIELSGGRQQMEAILTNEEQSRLLHVRVGSPALFVDRVVWDRDNNVVEHVRAVYRGDRYVFTGSLEVRS